MGRPVTDALVEYARPEPGMRVLDLGSGTGEPAITLALRVRPTGKVAALDLHTDLLEIADRRARELGLTNFSAWQADANHLPFATGSFDLVTSRFGVMFFADSALREAWRVLKPGRRACFCAWGPFDQPYWSSTMGIVWKHVGGPLFSPEGPNPFKFGEPGSLSLTLKLAGFEQVEEEPKTLPWTWPGTPEEVWEQARGVSAPFRPLLARVPREKWDEVNREVHAAIRQYVDGDDIKFGARVVFASGRKV